MGTKVADVMTQRPHAVTPQTPLNEVAELMATEDVGAVPLVEGDRLVGIVTDRDIVVRAVDLWEPVRLTRISALQMLWSDVHQATPDPQDASIIERRDIARA